MSVLEEVNIIKNFYKLLMLTLTIMLMSIACVSAVDNDNTNSTTVEIPENSQIDIEEDTSLSISYEDELNAITPEVTISDPVNTGKTNNIAKGTTVTINVQAKANFNYHYDSKVATLYISNTQISTTNLLPYNYDDNDRRGSFDYTFTEEGTYDVKVVLAAYAGYGESYNEATSNTITYVVGSGTSTVEPSVSINIYDMAYPNLQTITHDGDYVMDIAYNIAKTGGIFSNEILYVYVNGNEIGNTTPNTSNRLGNVTINQDGTFNVNIVYSAIVNGKTITNSSNTITYITQNTSGGQSTENPSASLTIADANTPGNKTIYQTGDYNAVITYNLIKSNHVFTNEVLTVTVTDKNGGKSEFNPTTATFTVPLSSGNEYTVNISYSATVNGETITADSNVLKYIINAQSTPEPESEVSVDIRDTNYESQIDITVNDEYTPSFEFYAVLPTGNIWDKEVRIICNNEQIAYTNDFNDKTWTKISTKALNETGIYVIKAELYVMMLMSETSSYDVYSKSITYHITVQNDIEENPSANLTIFDSNAPNNSTIYNIGDYATSINYNLVKSDNVFTNELLTIVLTDSNGGEQERSILLNSNNKISDFTFNEGLTYNLGVIYTANVGKENITSYSNILTFNIAKKQSETTQTLSIIIDDVTYPSQAVVTVKSNVDGIYVVTIDANTQEVTVAGGIGKVNFTLSANNYTANVESKTNSSIRNSTTFKVLKVEVNDDEALDINIPENSTSPTFSIDLVSDATGTFTVTVDGNQSVSEQLISGKASITIENLSDGEHELEISYSGDSKYDSITKIIVLNITNNIIVVDNGTNNHGSNFTGSTIVASDLTRAYNSPYDFRATFYDKNGNPLNNTEVNFIINGNDNIVKTDEYGVAKIVNLLSVGNYAIEIVNIATGETLTKNAIIKARINGNKDINVDYTYSASYKIRIYADNGQVVGAGENVVITLNNVKYNVQTNNNGYAIFKIANLLPKTYTITAEYKGVKVSNKVVVKQILKAKNKKYKRYNVKKFSATLKTSSGNAIKGKKVTFKIKGKTYNAKTNKKGVATIKIKKLYKLGKHKIKITYLKTSITKTVTIKR